MQQGLCLVDRGRSAAFVPIQLCNCWLLLRAHSAQQLLGCAQSPLLRVAPPLARLGMLHLYCTLLSASTAGPAKMPPSGTAQAPAEEGSPWLTAALTGAVLGTIAYRRPRAAGFFVGAVALATAPALGFMTVTVNRFSRVRGAHPLLCVLS